MRCPWLKEQSSKKPPAAAGEMHPDFSSDETSAVAGHCCSLPRAIINQHTGPLLFVNKATGVRLFPPTLEETLGGGLLCQVGVTDGSQPFHNNAAMLCGAVGECLPHLKSSLNSIRKKATAAGGIDTAALMGQLHQAFIFAVGPGVATARHDDARELVPASFSEARNHMKRCWGRRNLHAQAFLERPHQASASEPAQSNHAVPKPHSKNVTHEAVVPFAANEFKTIIGRIHGVLFAEQNAVRPHITNPPTSAR